MKHTLLRPATLPLLSLCALSFSISCAPAQQAERPQNQQNPNAARRQGQGNRNGQNQGNKAGNNPAQGAGDATAFAQIKGAAPKKRVMVPPVDAPAELPIKASNYPVPNGAIFVAPDAKEGAVGSRTAPTTLRNALKTAPQGATIVLAGGVYRDGDLVIARQLTIQPAPGEVAWIDGSEIVSGWVQDGNAWRHDGWSAAFPSVLGSEHIDPAYPLANNRDMAWINGRYQTQVGSRGEVGPGKFFVDYAAKALFIGEDPTGKAVEATTRTNGLNFRGRDAEVVAGATVRGVGFRRFAEAGIQLQVPRVTLENCTFAWNGRYGVQIQGAGPQAAKPADIVLRGITASCNGQAGVRTWQSPRLRVEGSTFSHNNVEGYRRAWGAAGIKVLNFDGFVFRDNVVANNYAFGLWLDDNLNDATVVNNQMRGNEVAGIMFEISHRALIAFNTIHDNNVGLMVSNSTQGRIWNNTFANNKTGVNIKQGRRLNHQTPNDATDFFTTREIVLKNNLFAHTIAKPGVFVDAGTGRADGIEMIPASDFNAFAPNEAATLFQWLAGGKKVEYRDLAAFQAASGREKSSVTLSQNPFVNVAKGDYSLKNGVLAAKAEALPPEVLQAAGKPGKFPGLALRVWRPERIGQTTSLRGAEISGLSATLLAEKPASHSVL